MGSHFRAGFVAVCKAVTCPLCYDSSPWGIIGFFVFGGVGFAIMFYLGVGWLTLYAAWAAFGLSLRWDRDKILDLFSIACFYLFGVGFYIIKAPWYVLSTTGKAQLSVPECLWILAFAGVNLALLFSSTHWLAKAGLLVLEGVWFLVASLLNNTEDAIATTLIDPF
jgi:hypothetical protein